MYGYESWTVKKAERWRIDAFERWRWRRLLRVPWTARRSNQSTLKKISPGCSLEGLMLKLNSNTLATWCVALTHLKRPWCWERLRAGKETTEDEVVWWHHWLNGHGFGWTQGVGDGQGGLACCGSWDRKESDTTERLNWTLHVTSMMWTKEYKLYRQVLNSSLQLTCMLPCVAETTDYTINNISFLFLKFI